MKSASVRAIGVPWGVRATQRGAMRCGTVEDRQVGRTLFGDDAIERGKPLTVIIAKLATGSSPRSC
jgi:hypothetical protein